MLGIASKCAITLRTSAYTLSEYLRYSFNYILFLRSVYPAKKFSQVSEYDTTLFMLDDDDDQSFMDSVLIQVLVWLMRDRVRSISLIIFDANTSDALERWDFDVEVESHNSDVPLRDRVSSKSVMKIRREIQALMRQISGTVSFLPVLQDNCRYEIHVVTTPETPLPPGWKNCEYVTIVNGEKFQMQSFSTGVQKMKTSVIYKDN